jgi:hypothetical protein
MTLTDDLRAWTRNQIRTRRAYNAREAELDGMCTDCWDRPRDGRHFMCWSCRRAERNN